MIKARTRLTAASTQTGEHILLAGERLFAEQGFDNVSLRQINTAAGQRFGIISAPVSASTQAEILELRSAGQRLA